MRQRALVSTGGIGCVAIVASLLWVPSAARAAVCQATQICPAANASCTISGTFDVQDGCTLDFGTRPVTLSGTLRSELPSKSFTVLAPSLTIDRGVMKATGGVGQNGGTIAVAVTGMFQMLGSSALVSVNVATATAPSTSARAPSTSRTAW